MQRNHILRTHQADLMLPSARAGTLQRPLLLRPLLTPLHSTSAPPTGFFFTGVPGLEESFNTHRMSPVYGDRSNSAAAAIPRSQSQPISPSSPDLILQVPICFTYLLRQLKVLFQPKPESSPVCSDLVRDMQQLEDADLWCLPPSFHLNYS